MVENCTGQLETLALTTSDPKEENRPLIQISCKLDLNKAELPIILISTLIVNLLAFAVLLRMRGSCDTLDHRLVSILNVNDTLTAGIFTFMWLSGWASCDTLLIKPIFCGLFGWLGSALVVWSAFIIVIMTTCRSFSNLI
ncbi:hypothetical protein PoB_005595900 [Plakobranchus ocellatus]|uniref:G-protein coupled receptors family 1 profile domain-containing protein n=1 Tax=Plakobranchus ocellatus TaxID=259542 RepID=A0AAV4CE98_9GAST|nr:hypothetical protein PoB_005595900 [Plakobranchus ocellatus]